MPEDTRSKLIRAFEMAENKAEKMPKKKHGNIPL
jgi:propionyl-CoA carboxylase beta chain